MDIKNIGKKLGSVSASVLLAATVMAGEVKKPEEAPLRDYTSVGVVGGLASNGASIDTLAEGDLKFGFNTSRRLPFDENYGVLFSLTVGGQDKYSWLQANCDFSAMHEGFEFYAGPGAMFKGFTLYFTPHFGARYHFGKAFYVGAEFGPVINSEDGGLQGLIGIGIRTFFDE